MHALSMAMPVLQLRITGLELLKAANSSIGNMCRIGSSKALQQLFVSGGIVIEELVYQYMCIAVMNRTSNTTGRILRTRVRGPSVFVLPCVSG